MANFEKRGNTYRIRVSCGRDIKKKQIIERMTWVPPVGLTPKQEAKELKRQIFEFEKKVMSGHYLEGEKITFQEFAEMWLRDYAADQLKPRTRVFYTSMLNNRIIPALGHLILARIQPTHLIQFMKNLAEPGMNLVIHYKAKTGLRQKAKDAKLSSRLIGISEKTWTEAHTGNNVAAKTAETIAKALKQPIESLFDPIGAGRMLAPTTQRHYLRCLSSMLSTAVNWQLIEENPCSRVRGPKMSQNDIEFLEIDIAQKLIEAALTEKDSRIRISILLLLYTGIRKGELLGLEWKDIDFENATVTVTRSVQYIYGYKDKDQKSIITDTTKTASGNRIIATSPALIKQLKAHRAVMLQKRLEYGDKWAENGRVITTWTGEVLHPTTVYHWVKRFLTQQGLPDMTVHGLRHTNISILLSQGVDLITTSRRAGHAKPTTTANIYAHAMRKPDEAAAQKLEDILQPKVMN